jgi:3-mercaptopyruvate sulfurtransferase SseA
MIKPVVSLNQAKACVAQDPSNSVFVEVTSNYYASVLNDGFDNSTVAYRKIDIDQFEIVDDWRLRPPSELKQLIEHLGFSVGQHKCIFIFDFLDLQACKNASQFDASGRFYSVLLALGFSNISIVHDATIAPADVHRFINEQNKRLHEKQTVGARVQEPQRNDQSHLLTYQQLDSLIAGAQGEYYLLDARSESEFLGQESGYSYIELAGRIPGALHISSHNFQAREHETVEELLGRLEHVFQVNGIGSKDLVIWYCGTSWRASRMVALTMALGFENVFLYDGGWFEWQKRHISS